MSDQTQTLRGLLEKVLDSDMAQREEDEGNTSPLLDSIRTALKAIPSHADDKDVVSINRTLNRVTEAMRKAAWPIGTSGGFVIICKNQAEFLAKVAIGAIGDPVSQGEILGDIKMPAPENYQPTQIEKEFEAEFGKVLDYTRRTDCWGRAVYLHPHVESIYSGFKHAWLRATKRESGAHKLLMLKVKEAYGRIGKWSADKTQVYNESRFMLEYGHKYFGSLFNSIGDDAPTPPHPPTWTVYDLNDPKGYKTFSNEAAAKAHSEKITKIEDGAAK